ncbi:MAG: 1,4-dihydroxy-2-naphthoate polyprenyltransferase [Acidimicrobiales bacterium]
MNRWIAGARPRTLPAAVVPVAVGTACAETAMRHGHHVIAWRVAAALVVALAIQVATNFSNDYSDGIRGTDDVRVGPVRLVASGLASPKSVKVAALTSFGVAGAAGLALALAVGPELLVVGAASMAAGWFYTGGSRPYGYAGLGELFVFVFFGLVATTGSAYVQSAHVHQLELAASVPVGLLATALLVVNNLRDIPGDTEAGKRTMAVRLGDERTRALYVGCLAFAFAALLYVGADRVGGLLAILAIPFAVVPVRSVLRGAKGRELIGVLGATGRLQLAFGLLLTVGLTLG